MKHQGTERRKALEKYINRIRNAEKKRYAYAWANHAIGLHPEPNCDEFACSYMARQGVRMEIAEILKAFAA